MPGPLSRIVVMTRPFSAHCRNHDRAGRRAVAAIGVLGVDEHVQERLLQQQRIADDRGRLRPAESRTRSMRARAATARGWRRRAPTRVRCAAGGGPCAASPKRSAGSGRSSRRDRPRDRCAAGRAAARRRSGVVPRVRRDHEQFEVAEHALQRVVDLVGDAGDELAERRELLGLRQTLAQGLRSASSRFCRVTSRATSTEPTGSPSSLMSGVIVTTKLPPRA